MSRKIGELVTLRDGSWAMSIEKDIQKLHRGHPNTTDKRGKRWIVLATNGAWYVSVLMFFLVFLQIVTYIGIRQQYVETKKMMKEIGTQNKDIEYEKIDKMLGNIN